MIIEKFEQEVKKNPYHIAVKILDNEITYKMLNSRANVLARKIINNYNTINLEKKIVALLFEHGIDMIIGTIGALKAHTIYVPLDPSYPARRLAYMLENSEADFIITNNKNLELARYLIEEVKVDVKIINMDQFDTKYSAENINRKICSDDIAYILYTSGSTGSPKGIIQTHRNVLHFVECYKNTLSITNEDRMTLFSAFSHDAAIMDIYGALLNGATLYPLNIKSHVEIYEIANWIEMEKITIWHSVPTVYRYFINALTGKEKFSTLRFIVLGGESVILHDVEMFQKIFTNAKLVNLYGQTESSYNSVQIYSADSKVKRVTLGEPVYGTEILVVDENREEVSPLNIGEIVILSDYVALGYWKDEEKSREVFQYNSEVGRTYWSGDLGKLLVDGNIEFIGRKDSQVKIRGYRIEVEEVENILLKNEAIRETVVLGRKDADRYDYLCAYIVSNKKLTLGYLSEYLSTRIPDYMIPSYFVQLEKMPLTPNGKIDRNALPEPDGSIVTGTEYEAPRNELEEKLASIWSEVLEADKIGINDNFFELGGHSLKATVLISKIHKGLNVKVPFREIFKSPTIKGISRYIEGTKKIIYSSIEIAEEKECYEASSAQKRMYLLQQFDLKSTGYNMPRVMVVEGELNAERLEESFFKLIKRHESLRTSFELIGEDIVQKIHKEVEFGVDILEAEEKALKSIVKNFVKPFDLSKAPLIRVKIVKISEEKHMLLFDMHHIISDGVSMSILWHEFSELYKGNDLPELRIQYKDFSVWQNELFKSDIMKKQEKHWLEVFSGEVPKLNMPTDFNRPLVQSFEGDYIGFKIDKEEHNKIKKLMAETGTTMYMVLLSMFNIVLSKYTGQEDLVVGSPIAGRRHGDLGNIIGMFVNTLAMRNYPSSEKTFREFLTEVRENALKAYENQDYQFEELVDKLQIQRDMGRNPLFDVMFVMQNIGRVSIEEAIPELRFSWYGTGERTSKFDITLLAFEGDNEIKLGVEYSTKLFKKETIERLTGHFLKIVIEVVNNYEIRLSDINMITDGERRQILNEFNDTKADYPRGKTINELFEEQVERTPDNIAVVYEDKQLTYRELNERANQLARILRNKGVRPDDIVGIMVERSLEMIVGIMGILKAGGAYLPIDPKYPKDRIEYMLKDSNTKILLSKSDFVVSIDFDGVVIDLFKDNLFIEDFNNLDKVNSSRNLAYVIYTSGTTGNPKGAMIEHMALVNRLIWMQNKYPLNDNDTILQKTTYTFDVSVWELLWWSLVGAKVCMLSPNNEKDAVKIVEAINKHSVTIMHFVPSALEVFLYCLEDSKKVSILNSLRQVFSSGEVLKAKQVSRFYKEFGNSKKLINLYGPTEAAIDVSYFETTSNSDVKAIPIGKPISNINLYILDKNRRLQPIGVAGELYISGDGLAREYLNKPELTAEKFVNNPFEPNTKMYRTGDLVRWLSDGNIEFLGRIDNQVKIRGFRIELGEIESKLLQHDDVKEAVALVVESEDEDKYICAYIVSEKEINELALNDYLKESLPEYMIPTYFVKVDKMPITYNGKLDIRTLPKPNINERLTSYEAPRNVTEEALVRIWSEVLGIDKVGINDKFFDLGGHSLKAIMLAGKIYKEFNIEMSLKVIFKIPTIKDLCKCIMNKETYNKYMNYTENQAVTKLNKTNNKNVFLFPPTLGYGIVYSEFAKHIVNHTVYSFDFIEDDNRIEEYVRLISNIQREGEIILIGYSAGGNLAFEVAKELEKRGYDVRDVILLDTDLRDEKISVTSENFTVFDNVIKNVRLNLNIPFIVEYISENMQRKLETFIPYWNELVNNGNVNANIHFISSSNENIDKDILDIKLRKANKWANLTKKSFKVYQGYGEHGEMVDGDIGELNAQIVNKILNYITELTHN